MPIVVGFYLETKCLDPLEPHGSQHCPEPTDLEVGVPHCEPVAPAKVRCAEILEHPSRAKDGASRAIEWSAVDGKLVERQVRHERPALAKNARNLRRVRGKVFARIKVLEDVSGEACGNRAVGKRDARALLQVKANVRAGDGPLRNRHLLRGNVYRLNSSKHPGDLPRQPASAASNLQAALRIDAISAPVFGKV